MISNSKRVRPGTDDGAANEREVGERRERVQVLRRRLLLSASVAVTALGGYGRGAYAACDPTTPGASTYLCTGTTTTSQSITAANASVTTDSTFDLTAAGDALSITGSGDISFVDPNMSSIVSTGSKYSALRIGGPATQSITVDANSTFEGGKYGISAYNGGTGALTVTTNGDVTGTKYSGISAYNAGTDLSVTTGVGTTVSGGRSGISAYNRGTGALTITANGDVAGASGNGIRAFNFAYGTDLSVTTGAGTTVSGVYTGVFAYNSGTGALTITANGDVAATGTTYSGGVGIYASSGSETSYSNPSPNVYETTYTPLAGSGTITVAGDVSGSGGGIVADGFGTLDIAVQSGASVSGTDATATARYSNATPGVGIAIVQPVQSVYTADYSASPSTYTTTYALGVPTVATITIAGGATVRGAGGVAIEEVVEDTTSYGGPQLTSLGITTVINSGLIDGSVLLEGGNDAFELRPGGVTTGQIDGGSGTDAFRLGGTGTGTVDATDVDFDNDGSTASGTVGVTGFEAFQKIGTSDFEVTGTNSETGTIALLGGTLRVNGSLANIAVEGAGGTVLGGTGTVGDIATSGTIAPGNSIGTLNAANVQFLAGSTFAVEIAPDGTTSDLLAASGTVTIDPNSTVQASLLGSVQDLAATGNYTVITAGQGVTGQFGTVTDDLPDVELIAEYDPNAVRLTFGQGGDLSPKFAAGAANQGGLNAVQLFAGTLIERSNDQNGVAGGTSSGTGGTDFELARHSLGGVALGTALGSALGGERSFSADVIVPDLAPLPVPGPRFALFGGALAGSTDVNGFGTRAGYGTDTLGAYLGGEVITALGTGILRTGIAGGYSRTDVDTLGGEADVDAAHVGVFAAYDGGALRAAASVSYAHLDYDLARFPAPGVVALGDTDGDAFALSSELSYDVATLFGAPTGLELRPFVGLDIVSADYDGFVETGAGLLNLTVQDSDLSTGYARVGVEVARVIVVNGAAVRPSASVGYEHVFGDRGAVVNSSIAGLAGSFTDRLASVDEDRFLLGAGVAVGNDRVSGHIRYDGAFGSRSDEHRGSVGLTIGF